MSEPVRRLLVAYDVSDDARRDRVAVTLQGYGERIQFSVFMVDGRPADFVRLRASLRKLIDKDSDRILLCDLGSCATARRCVAYIGKPPSLTGDESALIM